MSMRVSRFTSSLASRASHGSEAVTRVKRKFKVIIDKTGGSGSSSENEDEDEIPPIYVRDEQMPKKSMGMDHDIWAIIKAFKSLKIEDQAISAVCLEIIACKDLTLDFNIDIINNNLELLVNILETKDTKCKCGALRILKEVTKRKAICTQVVNMGIADSLTSLLYELSSETNALAAETMASIGWRRPAARALRNAGAIPILVAHLKIEKSLLVLSEFNVHILEKEYVLMIKWASYALWALSKYRKNKMKMMGVGIIPLLVNVLTSGNREILLPSVGLLSECSTEAMFQLAITNQAIVGLLVYGCETDDAEMQKLCALALARAAGGNEIVREMIRFHHGPEVIMQLIVDTDKSDKRMLTAGISAMWKSAISMENALEYEKLDAVPMLVDFLGETDMSVLIATVGAIGEIAKCDDAREEFISKGAMTDIISLLGHINEDLLVNSAKAVGVCADCESGIIMLDESDGLRLLWSLLKSKSQKVKIEALWAVKPCVSRHRDSGELIRSLMDSLNLLVKMLKNENREVLTAVCAVISEVALDLENLAVMTEQGVVKHLASLVLREPRDVEIADSERRATRGGSGIRFEKLRMRTMLHRELASALANCSMLDDNRRAFGRAGVIPVIVGYLQTRNAELLAQANRALYALSGDHFNCVSIQSCGAVPYLITSVQSACMVTQIAAVGTLKNIRLMLQRSEEKRLAFNCLTKQEREKKLKEIEAIVEMLSGHREPEEDKELILKGHARVSIAPGGKSFGRKKSMSFGGSMAGSEMHTVAFNMMQRHESGIIKKHSSLLSWRERMSLSAIMSKSSRKRSRTDSELSAVLAAKAATEKGTRKLSAGSSSSSDSGTQPTVAH